MSKPTRTVSCSCGQVLFDENCEPAGKLTCSSCKQKYRYLGGNDIEPISASKKAKPASGSVEVVEGSVEVFKIDIPEKVTEKDVAGRMRAHSAKRAKPKPAPSEAASSAKADKPKGKPKEIPGGIVPMLGFIIGFNAIALTILAFVFPLQPNGSRLTPFEYVIPKMTVPWPTLITLLLGHLFGFAGWIGYVYRLHTKKLEAGEEDEDDTQPGRSRKKPLDAKAARKARDDDDEDEEEEGIDEDDEEALIHARTRKMPAVSRSSRDNDDDEEDEEDEDIDVDEEDEDEEELKRQKRKSPAPAPSRKKPADSKSPSRRSDRND